MKKYNSVFSTILIVVVFLLVGCKSNEVISEGFIQKRKYTKGFFVDSKSNSDKSSHDRNDFAANKSNTNEVIISQADKDSPDITDSESIENTTTQDKTRIVDQVKELHSGKKMTVSEYLTKRKEIKTEISKSIFQKPQNEASITPTAEMELTGDKGAFSVLSLLSAIAGLFVAAIVFGILAIIFGIVGVKDGVFKGIAIAGIIIGIIDVFAAFIYLSTL